jgi:hypothetical protein
VCVCLCCCVSVCVVLFCLAEQLWHVTQFCASVCLLHISGLRGCTADLIILEEAAHLKPALFLNVIVPLLSVEHTGLVGITSPSDEQNYVSVLLELKNADGEPLFMCQAVGLVCAECMEKGLANCKHKLKRLPAWKSEARHDFVAAIYGLNKQLMQREVGGMVVSGRIYLFHPSDLQVLRETAVETKGYHFVHPPQIIDVGMDPGGGGGSDWTIAAQCVENGTRVVRATTSQTSPAHMQQTDQRGAVCWLRLAEMECRPCALR